MTYGEAMEGLVDGIITHKLSDVLAYGRTRRFYIDQRTEHDASPEPYVVKPLGKDTGGYWLYICPDCGLIHAIHNDVVRMKRPIDCGCHFHNRRKHTRMFLGPGKIAMEFPVKKILLDVSGP